MTRSQKRKRKAGAAAEKLDEAAWRQHQEAMRLEREREKQGPRIYEV